MRSQDLPADDLFSQRALEVAEDLFAALDDELRREGITFLPLVFHLDGSSELLDRSGAELWVKESVDEGHPNVRYHIEEQGGTQVLVNLAAFEDPDNSASLKTQGRDVKDRVALLSNPQMQPTSGKQVNPQMQPRSQRLRRSRRVLTLPRPARPESPLRRA